jgi:transcriptional regulator GlxA family with amidase domain
VILGECAQAATAGYPGMSLEEVGLFLIARFVECVSLDENPSIQAATRDRRRVFESAVWIDENAYAAISLVGMARRIGLSGFRFLRMFQSVIGITPHQYLVR